MSINLSIHPNDETLSRLADLSEVELLQSRAGRHVARCSECDSAIVELRALGVAARQIPEKELPSELWARIEEGRAHPMAFADRGEKAADETPDSLRPEVTRTRRLIDISWRSGTVRAAIGLTAAAAVVAVVLIWPSRSVRDLSAAGLEHIALTPTIPAPGSDVRVVYTPGVSLKTDTVWLETELALPTAAATKTRPSGTAYTAVPLVRANAGEYRGTLGLPANALAAVVNVVDARGWPAVPRSYLQKLILTSGSAPERPTLDAMERAGELRLGVARDELATAFARWAPRHPMALALSDDARSPTGILDWVKRFTRTELAFGRLDKSLRERQHHRVGELGGMIGLAYSLEDPDAAKRWTDVLVAEHPDDPRALAAQVAALHQMELTGTPRDSIAPLLPMLDTLYARSGGLLIEQYNVSDLIRRNGDSSDVRRWQLRAMRSFSALGDDRKALASFRDEAMRDTAEAASREVLTLSPVSPLRTGNYERARAYNILAAVTLWRGDARGALAFADSADAITYFCSKPGTYVRVAALLAVGDTLRAEDALANRVWWTEASEASALAMLGPHFDASRWQSKVAAAREHYRSCHVDRR